MPKKKFEKKFDKKADKKKFSIGRKKSCRFCQDKDLRIDYKDGRLLGGFITERGRLVPRRITGNCAFHQREMTLAVKRARILAYIPFTATQTRHANF
jgi:small subunit ribosomal protein S18